MNTIYYIKDCTFIKIYEHPLLLACLTGTDYGHGFEFRIRYICIPTYNMWSFFGVL